MDTRHYAWKGLWKVIQLPAAIALLAGTTATKLPAQQFAAGAAPANLEQPLLVAVATTEPKLTYSSSVGAAESESAQNFIPAVREDAAQPPPRRRYGRPRYNDNSHNADGSNKYTVVGAVGLTIPSGNTHAYFTPSYAFQVGAGRNFNKRFSMLIQFDYDHLGLQGSTVNNESTIYNTLFGITPIDGSAHVWSFTFNPVYNFYDSNSLGAYVTGGVGFYHKVTTFTTPQVAAVGTIFGVEEYEYNSTFDHYTSNAPGFNAGLGITFKPSRFANEKLFAEARYVFVDNSQRQGITAANLNTTGLTYTGSDFFPANGNRTTYIPIKVGIRF